MADDVRLWRVNDGDRLSEVKRTALDLEGRLQEWLANDISILDQDLMVIGREVATDFGGYIDILCIDSRGDLVVVELKRDKTPREITAQVLDYASWVAELSSERVSAIAQGYLGHMEFEKAFAECFGEELPESLNGEHRMLVVGSIIDESSERIMRYLSDRYGVNINAATFHYFREPDGSELLARVFLMEPADVELHSRTKGSSKRRVNLSYEELLSLAQKAGVEELYSYAFSLLERPLQKRTTRSSIGFVGEFDGSHKVVISLIPSQSDGAKGLHFQLYKHRYSRLAGVSLEELNALLPTRHSEWIYYGNAGADYEGYEGFITSREEIDRLVRPLLS